MACGRDGVASVSPSVRTSGSRPPTHEPNGNRFTCQYKRDVLLGNYHKIGKFYNYQQIILRRGGPDGLHDSTIFIHSVMATSILVPLR